MFRNWAAMAVIVAGCVTTVGCHTYESVHALVRDAETGKPICGAAVSVGYMYYLDPFHPTSTDATSDTQGRVTVRIATDYPRIVRATANGFIPSSLVSTNKNFDLWLYRLPDPTVEIVVPDDYRGPVKIELHASGSRIQEEVGKRRFTFYVSPSGFVHVSASPLLLHNDFSGGRVSYVARYQNGRQIPEEDYHVGDREIAFRWVSVSVDEKRLLYVIGTEGEREEIRRSLNPADPELETVFVDPPHALSAGNASSRDGS